MTMQPCMMDFYTWIDQFAPFATQEAFDNSGFLVGNPSDKVQNILFALDVTQRVLDEAERVHANLIITHHPLMFSPVQHITEENTEGRLIVRMLRSHICLISAHTNLDRSPCGINDTLASLLGLESIQGEAFFRVGQFHKPVSLQELIHHVSTVLHTTVRIFGQCPGDTIIKTMGISSGAGSDFWTDARQMGAQVFLTGEIKHHHGLAMCDAGLVGLEAGHFATEEPGIFALADALQRYVNEVKWNVTIFKSAVGAYAFPTVPVAGS